MAEVFLRLHPEERSQILRAKARELGRRETVLEKDIWVCWTLDRLFSIPGMPRLAFKGGTSLSKVYKAIHRFSEDVDITFDFRDLRKGLGFDDNPKKMSGERLRKFRKALQEATRRLVLDRILPHLGDAMAEVAGDSALPLQTDELGEKILVHYPSALQRDPYLKEVLLLEFGGRNLTEPCCSRRIESDIAPHLPELKFPEAKVSVLAPERTFWEKATLIHAECCRGAFRPSADRPSRHWYDLALLADHEIGRRALSDRALFASVVNHKSWAFRDPRAHYEQCLLGGLRLIPANESMRRDLESDLDAMIRARIFTSTPPPFTEIEARLSELAAAINASTSRPG